MYHVRIYVKLAMSARTNWYGSFYFTLVFRKTSSNIVYGYRKKNEGFPRFTFLSVTLPENVRQNMCILC